MIRYQGMRIMGPVTLKFDRATWPFLNPFTTPPFKGLDSLIGQERRHPWHHISEKVFQKYRLEPVIAK